jgi:hypothetical protein
MPKTKTTIPTQNFETTVEVCCHHVAIRYWDFEHELTDELKELLTEDGAARAKECIIDGYREGQLCTYHVDDKGNEEEIHGWWEIEKN